jgi:DNA polymerase V
MRAGGGCGGDNGSWRGSGGLVSTGAPRRLPEFHVNRYTVFLYSYFHIEMNSYLMHEKVPAMPAPPPSLQPLIEHKLAAGFPSPAADYAEKGLDLNAYLVPHKEASYFFHVSGQSMSHAGILDGDIVLVDRSVTPLHGHYILAVIDGDYTLKRLHLAGAVVELHPENPAFAPMRLKDGQVLEVWGVVTAVIRKIRV